MTNEILTNCEHWSRKYFITWDGEQYDSKELRAAHEKEERRILAEMTERGESSGWLPIGKHEKVDQRHAMFDFLSSVSSKCRSERDVWNRRVPEYLLGILKSSAAEIVKFANVHLAHRVHFPPERRPAFNVSLEEIEQSIISLWTCYNSLNSIFNQSYMTPDIIHSLGMFDRLQLPLVDANTEDELIQFYEAIKTRMESATNKHSFEWQSLLLAKNEAAE